MAGERRIQVWFDGGCEICRRSRRWAQRRDTRGALCFHDFRAADEAVRLPVPRVSLEREMVVRCRDGTLASGFDGWLVVLGALPGWGPLSRLLGLAPLRWAGRWIYAGVAHLRHRPDRRNKPG